jgi:alanine racemase/UDP-N-acetylmuramoyl-tripeptide--D-alanyl-D-alanine ligase
MDAIGLHELAGIVGGNVRSSVSEEGQVHHVSTHSDHIRSGTVFFALHGSHTDGHKYVSRAFANGAVAAVIGRQQLKDVSEDGPLIVVDSPLCALHSLAGWWRSQLTAMVVAIVGNTGKTVTKDALINFLGYRYIAYGSPGSYNSQIGVPLSLLECQRNADIAVIEAAASLPGEMKQLTNIIRPTHVVFTNLGTRFKENFDDAVEHAREIVRLAEYLPDEGWLLIGEAERILTMVADSLRVKKYFCGKSDGLPEFSAPEHVANGISLLVNFPDSAQGLITIRTPSDHIAMDVKVAISAASLLGVHGQTLLEAAGDYTPTSARMEVWRSPAGITVVRDIATTDGATFTAAVRVAKKLTRPGKRTAVVLADSYDRYTGEATSGLGRTIGLSGISELHTLQSTVHQLISRAVAEVNPTLETHHFSSHNEMRQYLTSTLQADDVVLVQAPRDRTISELSPNILQPMAPTRLYIDQSAIESNIRAIRQLIGNEVRLMAMVKALAYGTNPVQISICLEAAGVDALAVAAVDEGEALRRAGVSLPILVTLATPGDIERMARNRLTPLIYSQQLLDRAIDYSLRPEGPALEIHLEVDSGMHRTGFCPDDAVAALRLMRAVSSLKLTGLMTHFACADIPGKDYITQQQLSSFEDVINATKELGYADFIRHAANTAASVRLPETRLDMVRIGIGLFGIYPSPKIRSSVELTPAVSLISQIVEIHDLQPGEPVGYGATFRASPRGMRVGVVAAGYHDCIPRAFSNIGSVMVSGKPCEIVGTVSMDSMTIDLSGCPEATVGSDVTIFGRHGTSFISIEDVAEKIHTIPYELLARVGPRVQRIFTGH